MLEQPSPLFNSQAFPHLPPPLSAAPKLLVAEALSPRVHECRERFLAADGRFTAEQIKSIAGAGDGFDERSLHIISGERGLETGILRITTVEPTYPANLPFQHFYPSYTEPLRNGDTEVSRFLVAPSSRKGKSTTLLIEAAIRTCATGNADRLFIDVVDGDLGISPSSYERHFGFSFTGATGYDDNYSCPTHLMVLSGRDKILALAEKLTGRISKF